MIQNLHNYHEIGLNKWITLLLGMETLFETNPIVWQENIGYRTILQKIVLYDVLYLCALYSIRT